MPSSYMTFGLLVVTSASRMSLLMMPASASAWIDVPASADRQLRISSPARSAAGTRISAYRRSKSMTAPLCASSLRPTGIETKQLFTQILLTVSSVQHLSHPRKLVADGSGVSRNHLQAALNASEWSTERCTSRPSIVSGSHRTRTAHRTAAMARYVLDIFLSSTSEDLREYRDTVTEVLGR